MYRKRREHYHQVVKAMKQKIKKYFVWYWQILNRAKYIDEQKKIFF